MIRPTSTELAALSTTERVGFRLADFTARRLRALSTAWNSSALVVITELLVRRRIQARGLDYLRALDPARSVALVANHRSFFDFFAIECALFRWSRLPRRLLFPVRSNFFYDNPLGVAINLGLSGMAMFPPILRDPAKRAFNRYALRRCAAELELGRVLIGLHPEGSRSRDPDPLQLRAGKLGIGEVLLAAPSAQVVPVFIAGLTNDLRLEWRRNWFAPAESPIFISFGPRIDLSDLHAQAEQRRGQREAVNRCMAAIGKLADELRPELSPSGPGAASTQLGAQYPLADGRSRRRSSRSSRRAEEPKNRA
jgi:1-acyl-sn-glycerol-3-phosphate acyltransferase